MSWFDEIARWYLVSLAAGLAAAPFAAWLFRRLPGYGAMFARPVGLLAVIWPVWFLSSISPLPYNALTLILSALAVAGISWGLAWRAGMLSRDWIRPWLAFEAIFLVSFLLFLWFKGYVPRIAGTEKPMDSAFLSATIRTTDMPPADPWMAGETINYYYLGYLLHGSIARIAGLPGWIAFALALGTTFAMALTAAAGLAWAFARDYLGRNLAVLAGAAAAFLIMIAGNMRAPIEYLKDADHVWNTFWWQNVGWQSSRVIVDESSNPNAFTETIQEFPSFSFVLGDLHPHVLALPFTIVALGLALSLFRRVHDGWDPSDWREWIEFVAVGAILGALYPLNSWDFPTYGVALAVALLISTGPNRVWVQQMIAIGFTAIVAWSPFWVSFVPFAGPGVETSNIPGISFIQKNVAAYTGERSSAGEYLTVWGMLWVISLVVLAVETIVTRPPQRDPAPEPPPAYVRGAVIAGGIVFAVIALALSAPVLVLAGIPIVLGARLIWLRWDGPRDLAMLVSVLLVAGWAITILTEFFYIQDVFNGRFNTLFKIYYQVWTILGVGCGLGIALLSSRTRQRGHQMLLGTALAAAVLAGIAYPVISIKTWFDYLNPQREWAGLDGLAPHGSQPFLVDVNNPTFNTGKSADDVAAIRWLNDNAEPGDVLLEAPGCGYEINSELPTSRFSAFTGIPTVIGWDNSENQWRGGQPELKNTVNARAADVSAMFEDPDPVNNPLFDQYGITLLVVGDLEKYGAGGPEENPTCAKAGPFASVMVEGYPGPGWDLVFDGSVTRIYRRSGT